MWASLTVCLELNEGLSSPVAEITEILLLKSWNYNKPVDLSWTLSQKALIGTQYNCLSEPNEKYLREEKVRVFLNLLVWCCTDFIGVQDHVKQSSICNVISPEHSRETVRNSFPTGGTTLLHIEAWRSPPQGLHACEDTECGARHISALFVLPYKKKNTLMKNYFVYLIRCYTIICNYIHQNSQNKTRKPYCQGCRENSQFLNF